MRQKVGARQEGRPREPNARWPVQKGGKGRMNIGWPTIPCQIVSHTATSRADRRSELPKKGRKNGWGDGGSSEGVEQVGACMRAAGQRAVARTSWGRRWAVKKVAGGKEGGGDVAHGRAGMERCSDRYDVQEGASEKALRNDDKGASKGRGSVWAGEEQSAGRHATAQPLSRALNGWVSLPHAARVFGAAGCLCITNRDRRAGRLKQPTLSGALAGPSSQRPRCCCASRQPAAHSAAATWPGGWRPGRGRCCRCRSCRCRCGSA